MRPAGLIPTNPASTSDSPLHSCSCHRPTDSNLRPLQPRQPPLAPQSHRRLRPAASLSSPGGAAALSRLRLARRQARRQLHVLTAGGPSGGLTKSRSPRGSEVSRRIGRHTCGSAGTATALVDVHGFCARLEPLCGGCRWTRLVRSYWWAWRWATCLSCCWCRR